MKKILLLLCCIILGIHNNTQAQNDDKPVTTTPTLCSVSMATLTGNLTDYVTEPNGDPLNFAGIVTPPQNGTLIITPEGKFTFVPTASGMPDMFQYKVCDNWGNCTTGTVNLQLADVEQLEQPQPTIYHYYVQPQQSVQVCGGLGYTLQNNCIPNLYTTCLTHDATKGVLTYINDDCIKYTPFSNIQNGVDTLKVTGCGDIVFSIYTCNGFETSNPCAYTYYVIHISEEQNAFTQTFNLDCKNLTDTTLLFMYPPFNPNTPQVVTPPQNGTVVFQGCPTDCPSPAYYIANPGFVGTDTVVIECAALNPNNQCSTGTFIINVCETTGVEIKPIIIATPKAEVYPNPAYNTLYIKNIQDNNNAVTQIVLTNAEGKIFVEQKTQANETELLINHLPTGIYYLHLQNKNQKTVQKIVKL